MVLFCSVCGWRSARLAFALSPDDAEYHFRLWQAQGEGATRGSEELDRALTLNPRYSAAWIARGLEAESHGDLKKAEASLQRAAGVDHTYLPHWTLANFYLRAGDMPQFWTRVRQALEMAPDPSAMFQLCWQVSRDPPEILGRAIPRRPAVRRAYLSFLVGSSRLEAAGPLADELSKVSDSADLDLLLSYCDLALKRKQVKPALTVWNALTGRRIIPYSEGGALTNGDFSMPPLERGFDWRPALVEGASLSFDSAAREMPVTLSGKQPESFEEVEQYVSVEPGTPYDFHFRYRTQGLKEDNGFSWNWIDARTGAVFACSAVSASAQFRAQTLTFSTPPECDLARIALRYRRPTGSMRAEGVAVFGGFSLQKMRVSRRQNVQRESTSELPRRAAANLGCPA